MDIRPIKNDDDHRAAVDEIRTLWNAEAGSPDEDRLDVLATLVDDYERKRWPVTKLDPVEAIEAAMEAEGRMGTNYDPAAVDRLQVGMTKAEVIQMLGQPNQVVTLSGGGQKLIWVHSTGSMLGANARSVGLPFGPDGRLQEVPQ